MLPPTPNLAIYCTYGNLKLSSISALIEPAAISGNIFIYKTGLILSRRIRLPMERHHSVEIITHRKVLIMPDFKYSR